MPNVLAQTSPVIGISFCLIIVRLWAVTPEVNEDSWESSQRSGASRGLPVSNLRFSHLPVSSDRVKVEQDIYVSQAECGSVEFRMMSPTFPGEKPSPAQ